MKPMGDGQTLLRRLGTVVPIVLLAVGSGMSCAMPLHVAAQRGDVALAVALIMDDPSEVNVRDKYGATPLSIAAQEGHLEMVRLLLEKGAAIDVKTNYRGAPLSTAAFYSSPMVVKLLLEKGPVDAVGATPLYVAALEGNVAVVKLLLEKGAAVEARADDGGTPLAIAAQQAHLDVVQMLVEKGATVDARDNNGVTPLARATQNADGLLDRRLETAKFLLEKGANPNALAFGPYAHGKTVLQVAEEQAHGYKEIAELLRKAYAKQKQSPLAAKAAPIEAAQTQ
jgi:ankyrin repeat protein